MEKIEIEKKGEFTYPIFLEKDFSNLKREIQNLKKKFHQICVVTDTNVAPLYLKEVMMELDQLEVLTTSYILPAGEATKTLEKIQDIDTHLIQSNFERNDLLLALGGGVVGDMTGFAAATYLRGVDFIQVPTTLLAQVDSSIGGKTGVDFNQYKNIIGAFHQPILVYMNVNTLKTLDALQFSCGMGEILKHGLIKDYSYYAWTVFHKKQILERNSELLLEMIKRSCIIKKCVVEEDPKEQGVRAILNFGHTIGHAVEKLMDFKLLHGHCVAIGMVASLYLSFRRGYITIEQFAQVQKDFTAFQLPIRVEGLSVDAVLDTTKTDKKMINGHINFILLEALGLAKIDSSVSDDELLDAITLIEQV